MSGWQDAARALWGDEWVAPMSEVLGINRRTIERWKAADNAPVRIVACVERDARRAGSEARIVGVVLRRLANGETTADISREIRAVEVALKKLPHMAMLNEISRGVDDQAENG